MQSLDFQEGPLLDLLESWVNINSGSDNLDGIHKMAHTLENAFSCLNGTIERIPLHAKKLMRKVLSLKFQVGMPFRLKNISMLPLKFS